MALQNLQPVCAATDAGKHTKRASQREVNDNQPGHDHIQDDRQHTRKHTGLIQAHPPHEVNHTTSRQPGHDHVQGISRDTTTCKASGQATHTKTYGSHTGTPATPGATYNQPGHDHIQGIRTGKTHENIRVSHGQIQAHEVVHTSTTTT